MTWTVGDVSGSQTLVSLDHLYASHINQLRESFPCAVVGQTTNAQYVATGSGDQVPLQAANDYLSGRGGGMLFMQPGAYSVSSPVNISSNVTVCAIPGSVTISTTMAPSSHGGIFNISNKSNIRISGLGFNIGGSSCAVTTYGHDTLQIDHCTFTGITTGDGIIQLDGQFGVANMQNTIIESNKFYSITGQFRTIHIYPRNGNYVLNTIVRDNYFKGTSGPGVMLDAYDLCKDTVISGNRFDDIISGTHFFDPGVAVYGGITSTAPYVVSNVIVTNNKYRNTLITNPQQGFCYMYQSTGVTITDNEAIGAWTPTSGQFGPCIAPGRVFNPDIGLVIQGNYIQGFDAPWDPDSMTDVDVSGNVVYKCGTGFDLGYNIQRYVKIHDNVHFNSPHHTYAAGIVMDNSTPLKCEIYDNTYIDTRPIAAPSVTAALNTASGTLTIGTPYYYKVTALDESGETVGSGEVTATPSIGHQSIRLTWNVVDGALSYNIYRSTTSGVYTTPALLTNQLGGDYTDSGSNVGTGALPGGSTVNAAVMTKGIELTGNFDFSDVKVRGNRFYLPNGTFSSLVVKENGSEVTPRQIQGNELHDSTGLDLEYRSAQGNVTGATTFNVAKSGIITATLTGNITVTLTSGTIKGQTLELRLTQDGSGSRTATWPGTFKKAGGTLTLTTTAGATDVITMRWDGTNWIEVSRALNVS